MGIKLRSMVPWLVQNMANNASRLLLFVSNPVTNAFIYVKNVQQVFFFCLVFCLFVCLFGVVVVAVFKKHFCVFLLLYLSRIGIILYV